MNRFFMRTGLAAFAAAALFTGCNTGNQPVQIATDNQQEIASGNNAGNGAVIPNSYIVVLKPESGIQGNLGAVTGKVNAILTDYGISQNAVAAVYETALQGFAVTIDAQKAGVLAKDPRVQYVEQDKVIALDPNETAKAVNPSVTVQTQTTPWGISNVGGAGNGTGKTAWIIDTGIDLDHPDLNVNVAKSKTFASGTQNADDQHGHGTHVAGTIAAKNNTSYVVGVAAGATVVAVRVLNAAGSGTTTGVINGVNYVANNGASGDVANMSLGGGTSTALDNAVYNAAQNKGIKFAIAAGNNGANANNSSPARVNGSRIYTVSAMNSSGVMASWSNYGNPPVDYAAPGVNVLSLYKNGGTATMSGTSMAAPHVAGILLLGNIATNGYITGDKDSTPDPIAHR